MTGRPELHPQRLEFLAAPAAPGRVHHQVGTPHLSRGPERAAGGLRWRSRRQRGVAAKGSSRHAAVMASH
jgi:hypothetical protein